MAAILLAAARLFAVELPVDTEVQVRLKTKVSSAASKPKDPVEALVIAPVLVDDQFAIPAGSIVRGIVDTVTPAAKPEDRAMLGLSFRELELEGTKLKIAARVAAVDNARESVDDKGQVVGILASETLSARMDQGIGKLAQRFSGLADILGAAKGAVLKDAQPEIAFEPGVEMTLKLSEKLVIEKVPAASGPAAKLQPVSNEGQLADLAASQPFQTVAQKPPKPSDITNLMFVGSAEALQKAFAAAGWSVAASLSAQSKLETFRAIAEQRGYNEAPMSILMLDGQPPDLVFQKQNNTFAQRHHLRIWKRTVSFQDQPVWVCAATHDTGIEFSEQNRTFIHKIDSQIDRERAKVVNDLLLSGMVKSLALVERPDVPRAGMNATGDKLETDGRIAVLVLD